MGRAGSRRVGVYTKRQGVAIEQSRLSISLTSGSVGRQPKELETWACNEVHVVHARGSTNGMVFTNANKHSYQLQNDSPAGGIEAVFHSFDGRSALPPPPPCTPPPRPASTTHPLARPPRPNRHDSPINSSTLPTPHTPTHHPPSSSHNLTLAQQRVPPFLHVDDELLITRIPV